VFGGTVVGMQHFTKINMVDLSLGDAAPRDVARDRRGGILSLADQFTFRRRGS
jgi:hypothetical protein